MAKLETSYLGLKLKNPLIVSSSGLTSSIEKLKRLEESGAGAVVLKSVFEEQVIHESSVLENYSDSSEASDHLSAYLKENYLNEYIALIKQAKSSLSIPVIGSINCVHGGQWIDYAKHIETAGADALELNIFLLITDYHRKSATIERNYLKIVKEVIGSVKIPVTVKIGSRFTNLLGMIEGIEHAGAEGIVMFNRYYEPDINIDSMSVVGANIFSDSSELRNSIRWIAMTSAQFPKLDIAASTGIHTGTDAVKVLLAGASAYEVCSTIYEHGLEVIDEINDFVSEWMQHKGFEFIEEFKGKVNYNTVQNPHSFERAQFMKYAVSHEE